MKKKKVIAILVLVGAVFAFVLITGKHLIYGRYITHKKMNQIITALNDQDYDLIRSFFSKRALNDADDFEEGLAYLEKTCVGECVLRADSGGRNRTGIVMGRTYYEYDKMYRISMNSEEYVLFFLYKEGPTKEDNGLYSLSFLKDKEREGSNYSSGRAGIYHPGWD